MPVDTTASLSASPRYKGLKTRVGQTFGFLLFCVGRHGHADGKDFVNHLRLLQKDCLMADYFTAKL